MTDSGAPGLLLGKHVPAAESYAPELLYPIPRGEGRDALGLTGILPFTGCDIWHAYELSWLSASGVPETRVGRFTVPADSPNMVESKSFKLYLNSLNNHAFESEQKMRDVVLGDLGKTAGAAVELELFKVDEAGLAGAPIDGTSLDKLTPISLWSSPEEAELLCKPETPIEEVVYSHLLRSLCPVTGQPDWASVRIAYRGAAIDHRALFGYILSYRNHQEFHEQCIERMYCDIWRLSAPQKLSVQGFYTRRGGLDINPFRSSDPTAKPLPRMNRQ